MTALVHFLKILLDWSEVWAPLIPLSALLLHRHYQHFFRPVIIYLVFAFFLDLAGDIISDFKHYLPNWLSSNNPLYNVHSIVRFVCFSYFFMQLRQPYFTRFKKMIPVISFIIIIANFVFIDNFFNPQYLSGNLLATEAYMLLVYCMLYYLSKLRDEDDDLIQGPDFFVVTGLSIYVVVNFFVFLFYVPMIDYNAKLAENIWNVHNIAYIILCIFITKAFYEPARYQPAI